MYSLEEFRGWIFDWTKKTNVIHLSLLFLFLQNSNLMFLIYDNWFWSLVGKWQFYQTNFTSSESSSEYKVQSKYNFKRTQFTKHSQENHITMHTLFSHQWISELNVYEETLKWPHFRSAHAHRPRFCNVINAVSIGIQVDHQMKHPGDDPSGEGNFLFRMLDVFFMVHERFSCFLFLMFLSKKQTWKT